jgi:hypothetical protein
MNPHAVRAGWCAAACTLLAGTTVILAQSENRVAAQALANDRLLAQLNADELVVRAIDAVTADQRRLRAGVRRLTDADDPVAPTSRYLHDAARVVQTHHTTISSISAVNTPTVGLSAKAEPFDATPIVLTLEGPYMEVLSVTRRLSDLRVPAAVEILSIVRTNQLESVVTATLRISLERGAGASA